MSLKLHLGCGDVRLEGFINMDVRATSTTDLVRDILRGLPFSDSTVSEIYSDNFLEHLPQTEVIWVMNEMWRVMVPGGKAHHQMPLAGSVVDYQDPTHLSRWHTETLTYFEIHHARNRYYKGVRPWWMEEVKVIQPNQIISVWMRKPTETELSAWNCL